MADPTHTAIGTWSGGRFMRFGEPLDDDRMLALLRPDDRIRTVMTADTYGAGEAVVVERLAEAHEAPAAPGADGGVREIGHRHQL